jgi:hypothetical protein
MYDRRSNLHSIRIHRLANIEVVVLEVGNNLLGICRGPLLESGDRVIISAFCLQRFLDLLHVR